VRWDFRKAGWREDVCRDRLDSADAARFRHTPPRRAGALHRVQKVGEAAVVVGEPVLAGDAHAGVVEGAEHAVDAPRQRVRLGIEGEERPLGVAFVCGLGMLGLLYYRRYTNIVLGDKFICVVVKFLENDAFIRTAYLARKINPGELMWRK
jgi:hypothetical protein